MASCKSCMEKDKQAKRKRKDVVTTEDHINCDMDWFLTRISECEDNLSFGVWVNTEDYIPLDLESEERAKAVACLLDEIMDLH